MAVDSGLDSIVANSDGWLNYHVGVITKIGIVLRNESILAAGLEL